MYRVKLCLGLSRHFGPSYEEQIRLLHKIGFEGFFVDWKPEVDIVPLRALADELGMEFQSIHAPFGKMADMWEQTENTQVAVNELLECVRVCAANRVPIMVLHAIIGFDRHTPIPLGLETFGQVVAEAERLGVKLAFENTEGEEYLEMLLNHFADSPAVGFCWDTGHEMCYNRSQDIPARFGKHLLCMHLNDNLGIRSFDGNINGLDDLHLLPFDGVADWRGIVRRLHRHHFAGPLTFELLNISKPGHHENDAYSRMSPEEYLTHAYMRACRVAALWLQEAP